MPELEIYGRALARGWWILAMAVAAAALVAYLLTVRQEPLYQARATLVVAPNSRVGETSDLLRSLETLERRTVVATFARIPSTPSAREAVGEELGLGAGELRRYRTRGSVLPYTNLIRVEVEGPDPDRVAAIANATSTVTAREARQLYRIYSLHPFETATPPQRAVNPNLWRNLSVAGVLGLLAGLAGAVGFELLRGRGVEARGVR